MTARFEPDEIDLRIMRGRAARPRLSIREIAAGLRMPPETVRRRVTRLIAHKLIEPGRAGDGLTKKRVKTERDCLRCRKPFLSALPKSKHRICRSCVVITAGMAV